ncbi:hypothetical protein FJT64_011582 [Amphibalanus amphitrite]|uniref:EGF-like domain-containing protein n=1 Tax=Amphibalanus amphitrite TaxID=1232801 RepID=A0A6A4V6H2_AMPAM|nr:hypothetical protein FJT64_011582 [Amphibalanus amphitrite]
MNASPYYYEAGPAATGRVAYAAHLWLDSAGKRLPIRYTHDSYYEHQYRVQDVFKFWAENTCLTFQMQSTVDCAAERQPVMALRDADPTERYGVDLGKPCMVTSLGRGDLDDAHRELLGVLGVLPYTLRKDADRYVSTNEENLKSYIRTRDPLLRADLRSLHRCRGQTAMLPTPFDLLSRAMISPRALLDRLETRPVFVTVERRHQYLLQLGAAAGRGPTFYDVMAVNLLYKCPAEWAAACAAAGEAPRCQNHGYLLKSCKCRCAPGFAGDQCQTRTGPLFPLQPGSFELNVTAARSYDLATLNLQGAELAGGSSSFKYYVFVIVNVLPKAPEQLASVSLVLPFDKVGGPLGRLSEKLLKYLSTTDCLDGLRLLWGSGRRLRCECLSSLVNNEPADTARVLRARRPRVGLTLINCLGRTFPAEPRLSGLTSEFRLLVQFRAPGALSVADRPGARPAPVGGDGGAADNGTEIVGGGGTGTAALRGPLAGAGLGVAAVTGPLGVLLLLACLLLLLLGRRSRRRRGRQPPAEEQSDTDSDSGDESDADGDSAASDVTGDDTGDPGRE